MHLIQKLPLGLAFAACMMMSSCSQDDVQVLQPENSSGKTEFNSLRGISTGPEFPTTNGQTGENLYAAGWDNLQFDIEGVSPSGTSSLTHLWGNQSSPWIKPLVKPTLGAASVVTLCVAKNFWGNLSNSTVSAHLKKLTPGKKYAVKIYGASTVSFGPPALPGTEDYGRGIAIELVNGVNSLSTVLDLKQKNAEWATTTLTFTAASDQAQILFSGYVDDQYMQLHPEFFHFLNIYADQYSIKEL